MSVDDVTSLEGGARILLGLSILALAIWWGNHRPEPSSRSALQQNLSNGSRHDHH